jgi:hypothetical protein
MPVEQERSMNWRTFKCKSGAEYKWKYDDKCIAVKVGERVIYLESQALQFFEAELYVRRIKNDH